MITGDFVKKWHRYGIAGSYLGELTNRVRRVQHLSEIWQKELHTAGDLLQKSTYLKQKARNSRDSENWQTQACALVDVVCKTRHGQKIMVLGKESNWCICLYPEQHMAALALLDKNIVEQATGEGKTFSLMIAAYVHSLRYEQVHVITANPYLAARDCAISNFILGALGLTCGFNSSHLNWEEKQELYTKDIIFGTVQEFGFDYLRNHTVTTQEKLCRHRRCCALIDEVDSVLLDEATLPLVLSMEVSQTMDFSTRLPLIKKLMDKQREVVMFLLQKLKNNLRCGFNIVHCDKYSRKLMYLIYAVQCGQPRNRELSTLMGQYKTLAQLYHRHYADLLITSTPLLERDLYYRVDEETMNVCFTEKGFEWLEQELGYDPYAASRADIEEKSDNSRISEEILNRTSRAEEDIFILDRLLKACVLLERDSQYLIQDETALLVDSLTGRPQMGKKLRFGLHNALQAKENLNWNTQEIICGQISVQSYVKGYEFYCGTCGIAFPARDEFLETYDMRVIPIPPHRLEIRHDYPVTCFVNEQKKMEYLVDIVKRAYKTGRPVLIGAREITGSETIAAALCHEGLKVQILNARNLVCEHDILCKAGQLHQITVATNVAGRGADIVVEQDTVEEIARNYVSALDPQAYTVVTIHSRMETELLQNYLSQSMIPWECCKSRNGWELHIYKSNTMPKAIEVSLGLETIVAECMEEQRIEEQFRRRSARQGMPGISRVLVSLEDRLCTANRSIIAGIKFTEKHMRRRQQQLSQRNRDTRSLLQRFDRIYNVFRNELYMWREQILAGQKDFDHWIERAVFAHQSKEEISVIQVEISKKQREAIAIREQMWPDWSKIVQSIALEQCDQFMVEFLAQIESLHHYAFFQQVPFEHYLRQLHSIFQEQLGKFHREMLSLLAQYPLPREKTSYRGMTMGTTTKSLLNFIHRASE